MNEITNSRLSLRVVATFKDALSDDAGVDRMSDLLAKGYAEIDTRVVRLPSNRIDDFPGANKFELCENDGEVTQGASGAWTAPIELYGDGNWVTEGVARDVKSLFNEVFGQLAAEFGATSVKVEEVTAIRAVMTRVTEKLKV